jgi:hypothetical protein
VQDAWCRVNGAECRVQGAKCILELVADDEGVTYLLTYIHYLVSYLLELVADDEGVTPPHCELNRIGCLLAVGEDRYRHKDSSTGPLRGEMR